MIQTKTAYSWLDPKGKFYNISGSMDHSKLSQEITKLPYPESMNTMFKSGWQRVNYYGVDLYTHNPVKAPNQIQIKELKDFAIESRSIQRIIYDNEDQERIIWAKDYNENFILLFKSFIQTNTF